jgi:microcompartment protein CcmL/EutN
VFNGPAIALIELSSIARGHLVADQMVKKAPVRLLLTEPVSPGKYLILVDGEVACVEEAFAEGLAWAGPKLVDKLFLPQAAAVLAPALADTLAPAPLESVGVVETLSVAAALLAADAAVKAAEVALLRLHLARGIGGKAYFCLTGSLAMVEAAVSAAVSAVAPEMLAGTEVIPAPHPDFVTRFAL